MKQQNLLLKLTVVVSSVLLVGGFIAYRAGAFDRLMEASEGSAEASSSPTIEENSGDNSRSEDHSVKPATSQRPTTLFGGTKSAGMVVVGKSDVVGTNLKKFSSDSLPETPPSQRPSTTKNNDHRKSRADPVIISGTKSSVLFRPKHTDTTAAKSAPPSQAQRGSK
jgi:hypothetical protein